MKSTKIPLIVLLTLFFISKSFSQTPNPFNGAYWGLTGNSNTDPNTNFIGTTEATTPIIFKIGGVKSGKIGGYTGESPTNNQSEVSYGFQTLINSTGINNSAFGNASLKNNSLGTSNSAFGNRALSSNTSGNGNNAFGYGALGGNTTGQNNNAFGISALGSSNGNRNCGIGNASLNETLGNDNIGIGYFALRHHQTGNGNIGIGANTFDATVDGSYNTAIGYSAGGYTSPIGSNNIFIGSYANKDTAPNPWSNQLVIESAQNELSNPLITGSFSENTLRFNGGVEINNISNTSDPNTPTAAHQTAGLRLLSIPNSSSSSFLTTDLTGNVVLRNIPSSINNIYTNNGTLTADRTITMNNKRMIFNTSTSGRIYIGNTSPAFNTTTFPTTTGNYRLYVEGGILTEKVKVALRNPATNWADYVFASDYKLKPLKEVETFIKENKHLPGISSASELVKQGLDLAEMQAKQMEKIEELTLYIINQDKEIEELKSQMKLLLEKK